MENTNYSIAEEYRLPSNGEVYSPVIDPQVRLKSMTTLHEKKLLSLINSDAQLRVLSEIVDDCIISSKKSISSYDMVYGDFEYLLHKLRIVTFGTEYPISSRCPSCTMYHDVTLNLDDVESFEMTDNWQEQLIVKLPMSQKVVKMKMVTPRLRDEITIRAKQIQKKSSRMEDPTALLYVESIIETIDNEVYSPGRLAKFVEELPMKDGRLLSEKSKKIKVGLDTSINTRCPFCSNDYNFDFPYTREFFNPTID